MVTVFVGNLPYSVDSTKLTQVFSAAGSVLSAKVITDKYSGRSRGFGFVDMSTDEEAKKAIEMFHDQLLDDRKLVVNIAKPREDRPTQ